MTNLYCASIYETNQGQETGSFITKIFRKMETEEKLTKLTKFIGVDNFYSNSEIVCIKNPLNLILFSSNEESVSAIWKKILSFKQKNRISDIAVSIDGPIEL